ncbi:MAG TPA: hypothetical protein VMG63_22255, partial [Terriglobia bacterium]|nr:hypothetical protein [Terriglobia bacterium]
MPPLASAAVGFSRCHPIPQGLKALAIIGGTALGTPEGQYCSLNYPNASCDINSDLAQFLAAAHRKLALLPP